MDRRQREQARLACQISIGLMAGIFSFIPSVSAAPTHDPDAFSSNAHIVPAANITQSGTTTNVNGTQQNNIVAWKDFSVARGETVQFDNGTVGAGANNYLNVVTGGDATPVASQISGTIKGGNDVYIVNPQGVYINKGATVNVGNLYVSTMNAQDAVNNFTNGSTGSAVISGTANAEVVNMGTIKADKVEVHGTDIKFLDLSDVTTGVMTDANKLTFNATGEINLGKNQDTSKTNAAYTANQTETVYNVIENQAQLQAIPDNATGNYWLSEDINTSGTFTPISGFAGVFDGNFFNINGLTVSNSSTSAGLFSTIKGASSNTSGRAIVRNLGLKNVNIQAADNAYMGGLAGKAENANITDVFVSGGTIKQGAYSGGILGSAKNVTMDSVYNTANVGSGIGAGLISRPLGNVHVTNAYNAGIAKFGYYNTALGDNTFQYVYDDGTRSGSTSYANGSATGLTDSVSINSENIASYQTASAWSGWGSVSANGGENTKWRIYEGHSLPLLRSFLKANGTVRVNYTYNHGTDESGNAITGSNGGKDLEVPYNAQDLTINNVTYSVASGVRDFDSSKVMEDSATYHDANVYTNDPVNDADGNQVTTNGVAQTASSNGALRFYTGQDGYDLIGNVVKIDQRDTDVSAALSGGNITKTYDGTKNISASDIETLISGSSTTATGKIPGDDTAKVTTTDVSGGFLDADVGANKTVQLDGGTISLVNVNGHHNYVSRSASLANTTLTGTINPRKLIVDQPGAITKAYDGTYVVDASDLTVDGDSPALQLKNQNTTATATYDTKNRVIKNGLAENVYLALATGQDSYYGLTENDVFSKNKHAGSKTVQYNGLYLAGNDAKNYALYDTSGNLIYGQVVNGAGVDAGLTRDTSGNITTITGGTIYGTGTINRRVIDPNAFTVQTTASDGTTSTAPPTKVYDGTSAYTLPDGSTLVQGTSTIENSGVVNNEITFSLASGASHFTTDDGTEETSHVSSAKKTAIGLNATAVGADALLSDYVWGKSGITYNGVSGGQPLASGSTYYTTTSGKINPRKLYLKANAGVDKYYDGDDKVKVNGLTSFTSDLTSSTGYVIYNTTDADHQLVSDDGSAINLTGTYANGANVAWAQDATTGEWKPADKGITYTVNITNNDGNATSQDYAVYTDASAQNTTSTLSIATGKINPRKIAKVLFADTEKTYDGTNTVNGVQTNDKIKIKGVTLEDADTLTTNSEGFIQTTDSSGATTDTGTVATIFGTSTSGITGVYGTYDSTANTFAVNQRDGETGTQGGHVKRDADGNVLPQDVQYSNVALSNPRGNYVLDSSTQYGTGTIEPLAISADKITLKLTGQVKKTYDATSKVTTTNDGQNTAKNAKDYIASVTATTASNTSISLTPDLDALGDDDAYFVKTTTADGTTTLTATKDATENNGATGVQYKLKFNTVDNGDYSIGGLDSDNKLTLNGTVDNLASGQTVGRIEKRTLTPTIVQTGRTKEYDATTAVEDASGSTLSGGDVVSFTGWLSNDAGVTNASTGVYTTDGNVWHENDDPDAAVKDHSITYTAAIGAGTDSDTSGNYQIANTTDFTNGVATDATGRINQRETNVTFGKLKKTYDGTTSTDPTATNTALDGTTQAYTFTNLAPNGTDGTADALNTNRLSLSYTSEFANANANSATNPNRVNYTGLALGGDARGNYKLTSTSTTGEGEIDKNTVNSFTVNYTGDAFSKTYDGNANVKYDHSDTAYPTNNPFFDGEKGSDTPEGHINSITLGGVTLTSGYRIDSATYQTNGADSADAGNKTVKYVFNLNASILDNFDLSGLSSYNSTSNTLTDASKTGTIKQKLIKTAFDDTQGGNVTDSLGNLTGQVTKVYNGSTNVVKNSQTDVKSDAESDTSLFSGKFTVSGLVNNEAQADVVKFSGAYDGKDVGTTNVNYTAATTTGQGANYQIVKSEETTSTPASSVTYTGAGSITPKEISIGFDNVNKIYDTSSSTSSSVQTDGQVVLNSNPKLQESDFVNNEKDQLTDTTGYQNIKGYYVRETADGEVYDDANVEWDSATSQAKNKGVAYTGLAAAFAELQGDNNVLKNYTLKGATENGVAKDVTLNKGKTNEQTLNATSNGIANTVYFDAAKGKGKIRQLSLTMSDIKTRWNDYSRQYNGTSTIDEADYQSALSLYADSASGVSFGGQSIPILYRGTMNFFDIGSNPETEHKNAGTGLGIKATITGLGASSTDNNISVAGLTSDTAGSLLTTYRNTDNGGTTRGTITPRKIVAVSTQTDASKYDKTYDGTKAVEDYAQKVKLAHLNDDGSFDTTTTIAGDGTTATLNGAAYASKNAGTRAIYYDATLTNNDAGNYELVTNADGKQAVLVGADTLTKDADGNTVTKQTKGSELEGTINKRTVYVGFTGGTPTNIDKTYGETTITNVTSDNYDTAKKEVLNPDTYRNQIDVKAKTNTTGIVDSDANDVTLNRSAINAAYADGNVHRKSDGTADKQDVNFTNFVLTDSRNAASDDYADPMSNYDVKVSDDPNVTALIGKGTISPKNIVVKVDNSPNVKKIYDGTDALGSFTENGTTTSNLDTLKANAQIDGTQMMLGESVNDLGFDITGGSYASNHTNATNGIDDGTMGVNYNASWTNKNYNLTFKPLNAEDTDAGASHRLTVTATSNPSTTQDANGNGTATFTVNQGTISPKTLTVTGGQATKVYDGEATQNGTFTGLDTPDNTSSAVRFDGIVDSDKNAGTTIATGTATYYDKDGTSFDPNAGWADKPGLRDHKVKWNLELQDKDYSLNTTTPEGAGTITRATLTLTGDKQNITTESTPSYDGKTTGWQGNDEKDEDLQKKWKALLKWYSNPGEDTSQAGQYAVNGWYKNAKDDKTITNSTDITTETDEGGNTFETATTTYWNGTSDVASTVTRMLITEVPDPDDSTKTVKKKTLVSTTKTIKNPFNSDVYTTVTDAAGKVTSMTLTKTAADGTTTTTPVKSIADWYGSVTDAQTGTAYAYDSTDEPTTLSTYTLSGNFDKNYKIAQYAGDGTSTNPGNAKALTVSNPSHGGPVTPSMPTDVPDISEMNAAKRFVPDTHAYNYASHDELQSVTRSGKAGLEYASGGINVTGETTTSSDVNVTSSDLSAIGVQGAGSVVNLSGGNATEVSASRVDLTGGDTFTITGDTQVKEGAASIETTGAQTKDGSAAIESTGAQTREGTAAVETTDLQSTTDSSWLFGDEAPASERQSETSSSEDDGTSLFANAYDDDEATARSSISVKTADDVDDADDAETKDDDERKDAESSDASDESSIGIESEGSTVNVAS